MTQEIKRILYATDLSENAAYAFGYATSLAKKYDAEITILHVIDEAMERSLYMLGAFPNQEPLEGNLKKKITYLTEEINNRLKIFIDKNVAEDPESEDKSISIEVCKGYPANEILKRAEALNSDVVVMGTHGKGIVNQAFFGSVAKKVLRRVRKPVFIIPLPKG